MTAARWSSKVLKAGKLGKLGEMSLKSTLGALSMVGSLVLFSAIEASIEPDDMIGHEWLKAQKQQWQEDQRPFYRKPFTIGGTGVILMILAAGGLRLRTRKRRKEESRRVVQQEEEKEDEEDI